MPSLSAGRKLYFYKGIGYFSLFQLYIISASDRVTDFPLLCCCFQHR